MATELCKKNCLLPELHPRKMSLDQQIGLHVGVVELGGLKLVRQPKKDYLCKSTGKKINITVPKATNRPSLWLEALNPKPFR
jgi:hypothetical protein